MKKSWSYSGVKVWLKTEKLYFLNKQNNVICFLRKEKKSFSILLLLIMLTSLCTNYYFELVASTKIYENTSKTKFKFKSKRAFTISKSTVKPVYNDKPKISGHSCRCNLEFAPKNCISFGWVGFSLAVVERCSLFGGGR